MQRAIQIACVRLGVTQTALRMACMSLEGMQMALQMAGMSTVTGTGQVALVAASEGPEMVRIALRTTHTGPTVRQRSRCPLMRK